MITSQITRRRSWVDLITSRLLRVDIAWVEVPTRIHSGEQAVDHVDAGRRDVLLQPGGMFGADGVMMRQRAAAVHERLLDGVLERLILTERVNAVVLEGEGEVQACAR